MAIAEKEARAVLAAGKVKPQPKQAEEPDYGETRIFWARNRGATLIDPEEKAQADRLHKLLLKSELGPVIEAFKKARQRD